MARSGRKRGQAGDDGSRGRVVAAAIETLKQKGFAGASAREIARTGGFSQGVVFYHFGSVNDLLLAALDETSRLRLERYAAAMTAAGTPLELLAVAARVYREDVEGGHLKVLAELIAAASSTPELGPAVAARIDPWVSYAEEAVTRGLADTPFAGLVPAADLAFAVVALYLGLELLTHLQGDTSRAESLFASGRRLAEQLQPLIGASGGRG